ncbi:hypothetical protein GCM10027162_68220 [Streptomyces incanus]
MTPDQATVEAPPLIWTVRYWDGRSRRRQPQAVSKKSNTGKRYTAEFKRDAVAPALSSDKAVTEVARARG